MWSSEPRGFVSGLKESDVDKFIYREKPPTSGYLRVIDHIQEYDKLILDIKGIGRYGN